MVKHSFQGETEFRFSKPGARQVFLVGDFDRANDSRVPMDQTEDGDWICRVPLAQGVYRFRYLADGEWHTERDAPGMGWAPFDCNSITVMDDTVSPAAFVG